MREFFRATKDHINKRLLELVSFKNLPQQELFTAAFYSLETSAKRFRPLLIFALVKDFNGDLNKALDPSCALELVHTYSLIHDDLPCTDNDDLRHGKPTLHKKFSDTTAVLTGDFLLTYAFAILSHSPSLSDSQKISLISSLSKKSGALGMIGGQFVDLASENKTIDEKTLRFMYEHKTSALLECSMEMGSTICSLDTKLTSNLIFFAKTLGYAYQIADDIFDATLSSTDLGKSASDQKNCKSTPVSLLGLQNAKKLYDSLSQQALDYLPENANHLKDLASVIIKREF